MHENKIDFSSNDYLGFARSARLKTLFLEKVATLPAMGATGARLISGNSAYCEYLERSIANYHQAEGALLFSSGYLANIALISGCMTREDTVLYDKQIHASLRDGISLSRAKNFGFLHNSLEQLESLLKKTTHAFVVIESIYSTDGTLAPLKEIAALCQTYKARLIVDEAHATGVFGAGRAVCEGISTFARIHTFGKALGVQGAAIVCSQHLKEFLITTARPFIYTTAMSYPTLAAIEVAYTLLQEKEPTLLGLCKSYGLDSPIHAVTIGNIEETKALAASLYEVGFHVGALLYPTVPRGFECIRICFHTFNTTQEIDRLCKQLPPKGGSFQLAFAADSGRFTGDPTY